MEKFASKDEYYLSKIRESREEIARLKAKIERKDAALRKALMWHEQDMAAQDILGTRSDERLIKKVVKKYGLEVADWIEVMRSEEDAVVSRIRQALTEEDK